MGTAAEISQALADLVDVAQRAVANGAEVSTALSELQELMRQQKPFDPKLLVEAITALNESINRPPPAPPPPYETRLENIEYDKHDRIISASIVRRPRGH